jgi:uncharacterized protein YacL
MTDTMVSSLTIVGVLLVVLAALRLRHVSMQSLILGLMGAIIGLLLGALASVPLSHLPDSLGSILPLGLTITFTGLFVWVMLSRRAQLLAALPWLKLEATPNTNQEKTAGEAIAATEPSLPRILVDTSVIIDGRIADIAAAGFVPGRLTVPRFVLAELQNIADSDDAMRRGRGRRGLEVLSRLRDQPGVGIEVIDDDVTGIKEVDAKLVALGQRFNCSVLTTDFNLNQVAQIQGVRVLNVNELSNAIRPVVLPGEELAVRVVQPGKERNQGVGYLADGTMIVVENGDKMIGQEVITEVTRVFQTVAGKMIFATPKGKGGHYAPTHQPASTPEVSKPQPAPKPKPESTPTPKPINPTAPSQSAAHQSSNPKPADSSNGDTRRRRDRRPSNRPMSAEDRVIAAANQAAEVTPRVPKAPRP